MEEGSASEELQDEIAAQDPQDLQNRLKSVNKKLKIAEIKRKRSAEAQPEVNLCPHSRQLTPYTAGCQDKQIDAGTG